MMHKLKILHVTPHYEPAWRAGGIAKAVSMLCRKLANLGHRVDVFCTATDGKHAMHVERNQCVDVGGVGVYYFSAFPRSIFWYSPALEKACRERIQEYDIVHISSVWCYPAIPAVYWAIKRGIPYVYSPHGALIDAALRSKWLKKALYLHLIEKKHVQYAAAVHFTTILERRTSVFAAAHARRSFVVANGVDIKECMRQYSREVAKERLGFRRNETMVLYIGRYDKYKKLDILVQAMSRIKKHVNLVLAGPDYGAKKQLVNLAGGMTTIHFMDYVSGELKRKLFDAADIFTIVSASENFGNALVEAMCAGAPVIISRNVGIADDVERANAGLVVDVNPESVARAMEWMCAHPDEVCTMGENAQRLVVEKYDIERVARLMVQAYEDVLSGTRSGELFWEERR